ncbi:MAG: hypothetical protein ACK5Q5_05660 [Planctomycetaceae bacterium]
MQATPIVRRELVRLLNSTALGEVTSERQLYRDRQRAGFRIGDGTRVDLVRYTAWLAWKRHNPKPSQTPESYEQHKDRAARRSAELSAAGRDIGDLPAISDPARRSKAATNFQFFCESFFPQSFHLAWSDDHLKVLRKIEQAVLQGGLFAMAMPRGSGKTTICECACIWAGQDRTGDIRHAGAIGVSSHSAGFLPGGDHELASDWRG